MEPKIIEVEICNRFWIVEQRWGIDRTAQGGGVSDSIGNRDNEPDSFETAYILHPMQGPYARVYREWVRRDNLHRHRHPRVDRPRFAYIVEARTRRQVVEEMNRRGHVAKFNSRLHYPGQVSARLIRQPEKEVPGVLYYERVSGFIEDVQTDTYRLGPISVTAESLERNPAMSARSIALRQAEAAAERAQKRIDFLLSLPEEPTFEDDRPQVIYFQKRFAPGGRVYDYTAIKAGGKWYTSGPQGGHVPREWDDLVAWINEVEPTPVFVARKFREI